MGSQKYGKKKWVCLAFIRSQYSCNKSIVVQCAVALCVNNTLLSPYSPRKAVTPDKPYLSPKKDPTARRNLLHLLSPTKNAVPALPSSPSKTILQETSKPALALPYKYRHLAETFRCVDTVAQILYNRGEAITFSKLRPAVEEMTKRSLRERHLAQIRGVYPEAFDYRRERQRGRGADGWELVAAPRIGDAEHWTSEISLGEFRC